MADFSSINNAEALLTGNPVTPSVPAAGAAPSAGAATSSIDSLSTTSVGASQLTLASNGISATGAIQEQATSVISGAESSATSLTDSAQLKSENAIIEGPGPQANADLASAQNDITAAEIDSGKLAGEKKDGVNTKIEEAKAKLSATQQYLANKLAAAQALVSKVQSIVSSIMALMSPGALIKLALAIAVPALKALAKPLLGKISEAIFPVGVEPPPKVIEQSVAAPPTSLAIQAPASATSALASAQAGVASVQAGVAAAQAGVTAAISGATSAVSGAVSSVTSNIPSVPGVPSVPSLPSVPGVPSVPSMPATPAALSAATATASTPAAAAKAVANEKLTQQVVSKDEVDPCAARRSEISNELQIMGEFARREGNIIAGSSSKTKKVSSGFLGMGSTLQRKAGSLLFDILFPGVPSRDAFGNPKYFQSSEPQDLREKIEFGPLTGFGNFQTALRIAATDVRLNLKCEEIEQFADIISKKKDLIVILNSMEKACDQWIDRQDMHDITKFLKELIPAWEKLNAIIFMLPDKYLIAANIKKESTK